MSYVIGFDSSPPENPTAGEMKFWGRLLPNDAQWGRLDRAIRYSNKREAKQLAKKLGASVYEFRPSPILHNPNFPDGVSLVS